MSSHPKLIRTQLSLDPEVLDILKPEIENEGISLAQFVRNLMAEKAEIAKKRREKRNKRILSVAGILDNSDHRPDSFDHKDIYLNY
jgi:hypothetical protein